MEEIKAGDIMPVSGYSNYYVDKKGSIYSDKRGRFKKLKQDLSCGYYYVTLCGNGLKKRIGVHRLVAIEFIPNTHNKPCVNHINGTRTDNRLENLEWVTYAENSRHSVDILGKKPRMTDSTRQKIRLSKIGTDMTIPILASAEARRGKPAQNRRKVILNNSVIYDSLTEAAKDNNLSVGAIAHNLSGLTTKTKVGIWKYYVAI